MQHIEIILINDGSVVIQDFEQKIACAYSCIDDRVKDDAVLAHCEGEDMSLWHLTDDAFISSEEYFRHADNGGYRLIDLEDFLSLPNTN